MQHPCRWVMNVCLEEAHRGAAAGQYPIGAAIVSSDGKILSKAYNQIRKQTDPTAHPEILAIRQAASKKRNRHLPDCFLYTTLEPCPMCTAAAIWARLAGIVFGASQQDVVMWSEGHNSESLSWRQILVPSKTIVSKGTPRLELHEGFMSQECKMLLTPPRAWGQI